MGRKTSLKGRVGLQLPTKARKVRKVRKVTKARLDWMGYENAKYIH